MKQDASKRSSIHTGLGTVIARLGLLLIVPLAVGGCTFKKTDVQNPAEMAKYDPASTARIRLISGQGAYAGFVSGQSCEQYFNDTYVKALAARERPQGWNPSRIVPSGQSGDIFGMWPSDYQNNVIGMPPSPVSAKIDETRRYFDEHVVPAGQPLIAFVAFVTSGSSCSSAPVSFVPRAGADYEIRQAFQSQTFKTTCRNEVVELKAGEEKPIPPNYCIQDASGDYHTRNVTPVSQAGQ